MFQDRKLSIYLMIVQRIDLTLFIKQNRMEQGLKY